MTLPFASDLIEIASVKGTQSFGLSLVVSALVVLISVNSRGEIDITDGAMEAAGG